MRECKVGIIRRVRAMVRFWVTLLLLLLFMLLSCCCYCDRLAFINSIKVEYFSTSTVPNRNIGSENVSIDSIVGVSNNVIGKSWMFMSFPFDS